MAKFSDLTGRQQEIARLLVQGYRPPEIARLLGLMPKTVNTYRYRIFEALGIASDLQLFAKAALEARDMALAMIDDSVMKESAQRFLAPFDFLDEAVPAARGGC